MTDKTIDVEVLDAAKRLAKYNVESEEDAVKAIYFFPSSEKEIRLVELDVKAMPSPAGQKQIEPFYFGPDTAGGIPFPSGIALIRPEDKDKLEPPKKWGKWEDARQIWPEKTSEDEKHG